MATPTSPGVVSAVPLSGANSIDSLLDFNKWGGAAGSAATVTYSLQSGTSVWSTDPSSGYGSPSGNGEPWHPGPALSPAQIAAFRDALNAWADVANVTFVEVTDSASVAGDIRFGTTTKTSFAHSYTPEATAYAGDIWIGNFSTLNNPVKGGYGYVTYMHELGHALGFDHPHDGRVIADLSIDVRDLTIMSYRDYVGQPLTAPVSADYFPTTPMIDDISAMQYLYGANMATRSGDTTYIWTPGQRIFETIWDGGGTDTIDWSNQSSSALINLNAGQWSLVGPARWNGAAWIDQNLDIAYNVVIEDAIGGSANDTLIGNAAANVLEGNGGNDLLTGGGGADTMMGGIGDDAYNVADSSDVVQENPGEGNDTVTSVLPSYTLGDNFEALILGGAQAIGGLGNAMDNLLVGNAANNSLDGGAGNDTLDGAGGIDTLTGGAGSDFFKVDNASDRVVENAGEGSDTVASSASATLAANVEVLVLLGTGNISGTGNGLPNSIFGNAGDNLLDGAAGADTLAGGDGNDTYFPDAADLIVEAPGAGFDLVEVGFSYTLGANLEGLRLIGAAPATGTGNSLNNLLTGNGADNLLDGQAGSDTLAGGGGVDTLIGGTGNDYYQVVSLSERLVEAANEGADTVASGLSWTLGDNIEDLILTGTMAISGTGNALDNVLIGNGAANAITGLLGNDSILGLAGADSLQGNEGNDTVRGGLGNDEVRGGQGLDSLSAGDGDDALFGGLDADILRGGPGNDTLSAGQGDDSLFGGDGADLLDGRLGNDALAGGSGADQFMFRTAPGPGNVDTISDFEPGVDKIDLDPAIFGGLASHAGAPLDAGTFAAGAGAAAPGAAACMLYDTAAGNLYYDGDGTGAGAPVMVAHLLNSAALAATDFFVLG